MVGRVVFLLAGFNDGGRFERLGMRWSLPVLIFDIFCVMNSRLRVSRGIWRCVSLVGEKNRLWQRT